MTHFVEWVKENFEYTGQLEDRVNINDLRREMMKMDFDGEMTDAPITGKVAYQFGKILNRTIEVATKSRSRRYYDPEMIGVRRKEINNG